ncbi:nickel pincer cofactor biosynthesis protein LarB [Candidatus Woesearchaeota archaeon]|nr:nickel pincer cofactor biosynthesis protein LarB [Candidatus Woesearchaeota archaeon]
MNLKNLLLNFKHGKLSLKNALSNLKDLPYEDLGYAKLDHHRALRRGFPEVIFCQGKTIEQVKNITAKLFEKNKLVLATRATPEMYYALKDDAQAGYKNIFYDKNARIIVVGKYKKQNNTTTIKKSGKSILVMCAGTADLPVAEEAALTAEVLGNHVERLYDVGVAGIHRLLANKNKIEKANIIIVVAGMEGALASVVSGLASKPIIAVPTSVGYGSSFKGIAPLLTMLNSCSPGVLVVNIDNGFGAGYAASMINKINSKPN